jgi:hypothetical protein
MAAVTLDTEHLETLVESVINNKRSGMALLNTLRVANGKPAHPANYGPGDLNNVHNAALLVAMHGVQTALDA